MHISYKPLWHTLVERGMRKEDLRWFWIQKMNSIRNRAEVIETGKGKRFSGYCINEKMRKPASFIRFKFIGMIENIIAKQGHISIYYALLILAQNDKWQKEQSYGIMDDTFKGCTATLPTTKY